MTPTSRPELIEEVTRKLKIIESYLPKQLTDEEILIALKEILTEKNLETNHKVKVETEVNMAVIRPNAQFFQIVGIGGHDPLKGVVSQQNVKVEGLAGRVSQNAVLHLPARLFQEPPGLQEIEIGRAHV